MPPIHLLLRRLALHFRQNQRPSHHDQQPHALPRQQGEEPPPPNQNGRNAPPIAFQSGFPPPLHVPEQSSLPEDEYRSNGHTVFQTQSHEAISLSDEDAIDRRIRQGGFFESPGR
mmetsp:Transcript_11874/g.24232  ORF Transcript_11874/g.24232 Transcript_11874/m.24232 type:complete len:115 (+) Transcript_11874:182-526(+)